MMVPSLQGEDLWTFWNQVGLMVIAMVMVMLMVLLDDVMLMGIIVMMVPSLPIHIQDVCDGWIIRQRGILKKPNRAWSLVR